jgi:hypothetical protein
MMPVHDSNPERRNLTVLSLCIILFYIGGGEFNDRSIKLQVVNVDFSRPEVLACFAWGLLGWFCFRYWQVHQGEWKEKFGLEVTKGGIDCTSFFRNYLNKKIKASYDSSFTGFENLYKVELATTGINNTLYFKCFLKNEANQKKERSFIISSNPDRFIFFRYAIRMSVRCSSVPGYFVPYLLFFTAFFLGCYHL